MRFLWIQLSPIVGGAGGVLSVANYSSPVNLEKDFPNKLSQNALRMLSLVVISFLSLVAIKQKVDDWVLSPGLRRGRETKGKMN